MTATTADSTIAAHLAEELAALEEFRGLLAEEQAVLKAADADRLPSVVAQKSVLTARLGALLGLREAALRQAGFAAGRQGMDEWVAKRAAGTEIARRWGRLLDLAVEARNEHETNGRLIMTHLQFNKQALGTLLAAAGSPLTYGPDGQQKVSAGGRSLGSA